MGAEIVEDIFQDSDIVVFQGADSLDPGAVELHGLKEATGRLFGRRIHDVSADWRRVFAQMRQMLDETGSEVPRAFELDTVTISLGFSAHGRLVFVAEAGVEASIGITFKRL